MEDFLAEVPGPLDSRHSGEILNSVTTYNTRFYLKCNKNNNLKILVTEKDINQLKTQATWGDISMFFQVVHMVLWLCHALNMLTGKENVLVRRLCNARLYQVLNLLLNRMKHLCHDRLCHT